MTFKKVRANSTEEARTRFVANECDALAGDLSRLAIARTVPSRSPSAYLVLGTTASITLFAPAVRREAFRLGEVVGCVVNAMIRAEELGLASHNIQNGRRLDDLAVRRLFGLRPSDRRWQGSDGSWAYDIVSQVGNYAEVYDRNIRLALGIARDLNLLHLEGGLHYAGSMAHCSGLFQLGRGRTIAKP